MYNWKKKSTKRKWGKTIRELKRINRYGDGRIFDSWYETDLSQYRFRPLPEIYHIVRKNWDMQMVPFVMELLYCKSSLCYRDKLDNLFKLIIIDNATGEHFACQNSIEEKIELLSYLKEDLDITLLNEINWNEVEQAKNMAAVVHADKNWREYYSYIIKPIMQEIVVYGARGELFVTNNAEEIAVKLSVPKELDSEVVGYLIRNALGYIDAVDALQYNPLWIFGSECYADILEDIWSWDWTKLEQLSRKHLDEIIK